MRRQNWRELEEAAKKVAELVGRIEDWVNGLKEGDCFFVCPPAGAKRGEPVRDACGRMLTYADVC
jgi:hypothetical protein